LINVTNKYKRVIALLSDVHIGSRYAVFPDNYITEDGDKLSNARNAGQLKLLKCWKDFSTICDKFKVDSIFLVGDITAGMNPKELGMYMMTTDLDEQVDASVLLLKPLCENRKVGVWSGTTYHESLATNVKIHKRMAELLDGRYMGNLSNVRLTPSRKIANITHKSTGAVIYPETVMGRDMMLFKEAEALGLIPKIHVIIRGHRHKWNYIHKVDQHYIQLPCWQAFIPWKGITRWYPRMQPDIGGALLLIDSKDRIRVWHFLYAPVHIADQVKSM